MSDEPGNMILRLLRDMRAEMATQADVARLRSETAAGFSELRSEMNSLRADVASDTLVLRKDVADQMAGPRRAVFEYHSSVVGHGILIAEPEERIRRVGQHLNLPAVDSR